MTYKGKFSDKYSYTKLEAKDSEESLFNMGLAILKRIDVILTSCVYASVRADFVWWWRLLLALERQIPNITEEEGNKITKLEEDIPKSLAIWSKKKDREKILNAKVEKKLMSLEKYLRHLLDKRQMLMGKKPKPEEAITRT